MTRTRLVVAMTVAAVTVGTPADAQIAERVNAVRDGSVRMSFAAREGVCGWGDSNIRIGSSNRGSDDWESDCQSGPVRVVLVRRGGETTDIDTYIGGRWRDRPDATDMGTVSAPLAAEYFLRLAATLDAEPGEDAVFPAAVADSVTIWPELSDLARQDDRPLDIREAAVFWLGQTPDEGVVVHLEALVTSGEPVEIREKAIFALSQHESEQAASVLRGIAEGDQFEFAVREKAIFWLGQRQWDDEGGYLRGLYASLTHRELQEKVIFAVSQHRTDADREWLRDLAVDSGEPLELREKAVFWLGQQREDGSELRELYSSVTSQALKEKVIFSVSQQRGEDDLAWLIQLAKDDGEPAELREKAIFWAGQMRGDGSELYDLYDEMSSVQLRERLIFAYSQRKRDPAAVDKLIDIARNDSNGELRRKAIFWLGQTKDPRAIDFLSELIGQ